MTAGQSLHVRDRQQTTGRVRRWMIPLLLTVIMATGVGVASPAGAASVVGTVATRGSQGDVVFSSDGTRAWVTGLDSSAGWMGYLTLVDTGTRTAITSRQTIPSANAVAVSPDGSRVWVAGDSILALDGGTLAPVGEVAVPYGSVRDLAITPDGTRLYATIGATSDLLVYDTASLSLTSRITVGGDPKQVVVSSDGTRAWTSDAYSGTVSMIDTASNSVLATTEVGHNPGPLIEVPAPGGNQVWVGLEIPGEIVALDASTNARVATIPGKVWTSGMAASRDGSRVWLGDGSVVDPTTRAVLAETLPTRFGWGLHLAPDGRHLWALGSGVTTIIDVSPTTPAEDPTTETPTTESSTAARKIPRVSAVRARAKGSSVTVSWKPPARATRGTSYRVTASPGGLGCTSKTRTCTVTGLEPGRRYRFAVRVVTPDGTGKPVVSRAVRLPLPPPPPAPTAPQPDPGKPSQDLS